MRGDHFTFMIGDNLTRFVIETTEYQLDGNELPVSINCAYETPDLMIKPIIKYLEKLGWEEE